MLLKNHVTVSIEKCLEMNACATCKRGGIFIRFNSVSLKTDTCKCSLNEELLVLLLSEIQAGNATIWSFSGRIPTIGCHRVLHFFFKLHFNRLPSLQSKIVLL